MLTISAEGKVGEVIYSYTSQSLEEENLSLKEAVRRLTDELERLKKAPLMLCEVRKVKGASSIIRIPNGNQFLVEVASGCKNLRPGDLVFVEQKNLAIIKKANITKRFNVEKFVIVEKPNVSWSDIGGLEQQQNEIQEVVELPLKSPELFENVGIQPPKGILLHGAAGTGKTLTAKAVAKATNAAFIQVVASELVQKFIGEGAKLIKEIFRLAREKAPSIVFIDEIDALAAKRVELGTSGEREVQRTFMQLLAEIDGFKSLGNVKIICSTNRKDILDPALLRPGRLDRHIYFPLPNNEEKKEILKIHTRAMNLASLNFEKLLAVTEHFTGAELKALCTEAGYFAIRNRRTFVDTEDFLKAAEKVKQREEEEGKDYLGMFG